MPEWFDLVEVVGVVVLLAILVPVLGLVGRRRWLSGRGRVFDCALLESRPRRGSGWMLGTARFIGDNLEWYRVYSLSLRPRLVLPRSRAMVQRVRDPDPREARDLFPRTLVVELGPPHEGTSLAMDREHLTAFHSWTEAGAPGGGLVG